MKGKRILVTGGAGLLGTCWNQCLMSHGMTVKSTYFSRTPPEHLKINYQRYDFIKFEDCLDATKGQNYVIICAVQASGVAGVKPSPTAQLCLI